jgi:hypothetical protein
MLSINIFNAGKAPRKSTPLVRYRLKFEIDNIQAATFDIKNP